MELLQAFFEVQADARPEQTALVCGETRVTYAELERKANQLARFLRSRGVGPGALVGMLLPRETELYVALLAILKAGAAYVPLDPDFPSDRIAYILSDCKVHTLLTTSDLYARHRPTNCDVLLLDTQWREVARQRTRRLTPAETGATSRDLCYVIYTSGSTGWPKGVEIEHRSACNLVEAEAQIFGVSSSDRVFQGFSIAFDASVEEVWLALVAGATLVVGTADMVRAGPALARFMTENGVSVLSCVPTLLSMLREEIPTVRLLIVGGEPCPQHIVRRWCAPGRRMVNTYGPTEATVIATFAECDPEKAVTIGRPVPGYHVHILDPDMQPVEAGAAGELYIGGAGLARGYVGRPDLTAQRFVADPFSVSPHARLYKSGDLGRYNADGEIEFLGRTDTQVKLRGFRIELSEIESALMQFPEVLSAVVTVREDVPGVQQLVGYIVPRGDGPIGEDATKARLRSRLPAYMIPAVLEPLTDLPTLPSGKIDRKLLPPPRPRIEDATYEAPGTPCEKTIAQAWERLFQRAPISVHADFFLDLGGHSLLAASMVSELRDDHAFSGLSVLDVYQHPTVRALAAALQARQRTPVQDGGEAECAKRPAPVGRAGYRLCAVAQLGALYVLVGFVSVQWLAPYLTYNWMTEHRYAVIYSLLASAGVLFAFLPLALAASVVIKWVVLGRVQPGSYPLWGPYYLRWWFVNRILDLTPIGFLAGTPLLNVYCRLMGARIGSNVCIGTDAIKTFDLLSVGDDSSIGMEASLFGYTVEDGMLRLGPITIGEGCFVGARSILRPFTRMEDASSLGELGMLPEGASVPSGEKWVGSPARPLPAGTAGDDRAESPRPSRARRGLYGVLHALGVFILPAVYLIALFPGIVLLHYVARTYGHLYSLLVSPVVAVSFVVFMCLEIVAVKWLVLGKVKAGRYPLHSSFYVRKWFVDQLMEMSLAFLGPLYATLYVIPWYRLLGASLGRHVEMSTACSASPDLCFIDDESFVADCVSLGVARIDRGMLTIASTRVGRRAFVGNSALIPAGAVVGDDCLIGCLSAPPLSLPGAAQPSTAWLGSPAIFLPQRQASAPFSESTTFTPSRKLYGLRLAIEFCRVTMPTMFFVMLSSVLFSALARVHKALSPTGVALLFPLMYLACGIVAALIVVVLKWVLMGRYKPAEKPLWSTFVWRTELLTALHEHLADPFLIELLLGTPFVCWFFRLLGSKIGSGVFMETTALTEFDLITIGDGVALNVDCTIQTHLFEDRVMKMSTIDIGPRCTAGAGSVVLYDTVLQEGTVLGDLSLVMKGESLPAWTRWEGTPARRAAPPQRIGAVKFFVGSRPAVHRVAGHDREGSRQLTRSMGRRVTTPRGSTQPPKASIT